MGMGWVDGWMGVGGFEGYVLTEVLVWIELSLTVPITNSLAFLFTVLGEWFAEKKTISRGEHVPQLNLPLFATYHLWERGVNTEYLHRYLDRDDFCPRWYSVMCTVEEYVIY